MGRIIAIANQKGGVGKDNDHREHRRIPCCSGKKGTAHRLRPAGQLNERHGCRPERADRQHVRPLHRENAPLTEIKKNSHFPWLDVVPAGIDLVGVEVELIQMLARERVLKKALEPVKNNYDYILIDCPPSLGLLTVNALTAADSVLIPVQTEYYALEGLSALMNTIKLIKQDLNPELAIEGVLLTMYDSRNNLAEQVAR